MLGNINHLLVNSSACHTKKIATLILFPHLAYSDYNSAINMLWTHVPIFVSRIRGRDEGDRLKIGSQDTF
jgi:hypothetical protein